jgi:hypothetical protein
MLLYPKFVSSRSSAPVFNAPAFIENNTRNKNVVLLILSRSSFLLFLVDDDSSCISTPVVTL